MAKSLQTVRAEPEHDDALNHIWHVVYSGEEPEASLRAKKDGESHFVTLLNGEPAAACQVVTHAVMRGGQAVPCAAIGAVATLPEYRALGVGSALMTDLLGLLRAEGFVLANLYAFRESFYQRFGYAVCGWRYQVTCPQNRMPATKCTLPVRQIKPENASELNVCYQEMIGRLSGCFIRGSADWSTRLGQKPKLIYAVGDPVEGYLWSEADGFWGKLTVGEIAWSSRPGYESIMAVLRGLAHNQSTVVWNEPSNSPFLTRYLDQGAEVRVHRQTMYRVLNVPKALEIAGPTGCTFAINDAQISQNSGPHGAGPRVEMDIESFSQAFMGSPSLADLIAQERVTSEAKGEADALLQAFPACPVLCMDFF